MQGDDRDAGAEGGEPRRPPVWLVKILTRNGYAASSTQGRPWWGDPETEPRVRAGGGDAPMTQAQAILFLLLWFTLVGWLTWRVFEPRSSS
jgi:hypothetical protein